MRSIRSSQFSGLSACFRHSVIRSSSISSQKPSLQRLCVLGKRQSGSQHKSKEHGACRRPDPEGGGFLFPTAAAPLFRSPIWFVMVRQFSRPLTCSVYSPVGQIFPGAEGRFFQIFAFPFFFRKCEFSSCNPVRVGVYCHLFGGLAQLVRALASHARGHWFESSSLHQSAAGSTCLRRFLRQKKSRNPKVSGLFCLITPAPGKGRPAARSFLLSLLSDTGYPPAAASGRRARLPPGRGFYSAPRWIRA